MFLDLNKDFENFHKRGQRLIARRMKGLDQGVSAMFTFFCEIPKYMHAFRNILSLLTGLPTWIGISCKWANMLTELAGDGECRLALFDAIRNFLADEIFHCSRPFHQTSCIFTWAALSIEWTPY